MRDRDDCLRACVESLFDCDDVPHFVRDHGAHWFEGVSRWADERGMEVVFLQASLFTPPGKYIAIGSTDRSTESHHAVIMENRELVHDPYTGSGTKGISGQESVLLFTLKDFPRLRAWTTKQ